MATRNRYVKVDLLAPCAARLQDGKVVGQADEYLLIERAAPKERARAAAPKKRAPRSKPTIAPDVNAAVGA